MANASNLVAAPPIEVWPDTTLRVLAETLKENGIGAALVRAHDGGISGVISERDIVMAMAEGADPDADRVSDYMVFDVEFAPADASVDELAAMMLDGGIRHLPVANSDGKVIGVLSMRDILAAKARAA